MNFVAQVEEQLRDLGYEAKKKYPGVKEASERAILQLRTLQNQYVVAVRKAISNQSPHPTTALFQSQDILRPFLWAANYPDVSYTILTIVFNAITLLMDGDAISPGDIIHVIRVLSIHALICTKALNHAAGAIYMYPGSSETGSFSGANSTTSTSGPTISTSFANVSAFTKNIHSPFTSNKTTKDGGPYGHASSSGNLGSTSASTTMSTLGSSLLSSVSGMILGSGGGGGNNSSSSSSASHSTLAAASTMHSHKHTSSSTDTAILSHGTAATTGGGGYSSSTGQVGSHPTSTRSLKEDETLAVRIVQMLTVIIDSQGINLTEDVLSACITVCFTLISTDATLPIDTSTIVFTTLSGESGAGGSGISGAGGGGIMKGGGKGTMYIGGGMSTTDTSIHTSSNSSSSNMSSSVSGPIASARKVRRAASTSLRQIISTVFDLATTTLYDSTTRISTPILSSSYDDDDDDDDEGSDKDRRSKKNALPLSLRNDAVLETMDSGTRYKLRSLALRTLEDLCSLAEIEMKSIDFGENASDRSSQMRHELHGPFLQALKGSSFGLQKLHPPPRTFCLDLLNMILRQNFDLFTNTNYSQDLQTHVRRPDTDTCTSTEQDQQLLQGGQRENQSDPTFTALLRDRICPIVTKTFSVEYTAADATSKRIFVGISDQMASYALFLSLINISSTIIKRYGHESSAKRIDDSMTPSTSNEKSTSMQRECRIILSCLVKFVTVATEMIRDTGNFEDDFVYMVSSDIDPSNLGLVDFVIPSHIHWRAAVSLEFFYLLLRDHSEIFFSLQSSSSKEDEDSLLNLITKSIGDFGSVATSCKSRIYAVVRYLESYSHDETSTNRHDCKERRHASIQDLGEFTLKRFNPLVIARGRDLLRIYDDWHSDTDDAHVYSDHQDVNSSKGTSLKLVPYSDLRDDPSRNLLCEIGETSWVAFNCVLLLAESLFSYSKQSKLVPREELEAMSCSFFVPSLAVLQHFLRRFPGVSQVTMCALSGYIFVANTSFPLRFYESKVHRKVLLGSLSTLSVPSTNQNGISSSISDQNLLSLSALLYITHINRDSLEDDWDILLRTFERIVIFAASSNVNDSVNLKLQSILTCFSRITAFSSCLSNDSLNSLISALCSQNVLEDDLVSPDVIVETVKLSNFSGRPSSTRSISRDVSSRSMRYNGWSFFDETYEKLSAIRLTVLPDSFRNVPFSLIILAGVVMENSFRMGPYYPLISKCFSRIASFSENAEMRSFVLEIETQLATWGLSLCRLPPSGPGFPLEPIVCVDDTFLLSDQIVSRDIIKHGVDPSRNDLLLPLCETLVSTKYRDTADSGLCALQTILEGAGHSLSSDAWVCIIDTLTSLSGERNASVKSDRSTSAWAPTCTLAFRCLKLIVDDYLDELPSRNGDSSVRCPRSALLDCCASFGSSEHDVNTSLTATGMLWTIGDQDATPSSLHHVMSKLALLATDTRQEVRNCSINTLFSCIVGLGQSFIASQWRDCIVTTTFSVLDKINTNVFEGTEEQQRSTNDDSSGNNRDRYKMTLHHSRDSSSKQWTSTLILALKGWERTLRIFFNKLVAVITEQHAQVSDGNSDNDEASWFDMVWYRILEWAYLCSTRIGGRETLDLRLAGVDLLILCAQVSCQDGVMAATTPARVGTNMQVINGALRSVRETSVSMSGNNDFELSSEAKEKKTHLYSKAFSVLERFHLYLKDETSMSLENDSNTSNYFVESVFFQVLTKLSQGLSKLYECCKGHEMAPFVENIIQSNQNVEHRFIDIIFLILLRAGGGQRSKFLNQAQRVCLELLQNMASQASSRALEKLTIIGDTAFFGSLKESSAGEYLEFEAAKVVSALLGTASVHDRTKINVMEMIIDLHALQNSRMNYDEGPCERNYNLTANVLKEGFRSLHVLEQTAELEEEKRFLDNAWEKVIDFFRLILTSEFADKAFASDVKHVLEMIRCFCGLVPVRKYQDLELLLCKASYDMAHLDDKLSNVRCSVDVQLQIFRETYSGLCSTLAGCHGLQSLTSQVLSIAMEVTENKDIEQSHRDFYINICIHICRSLCSLPDSSGLAVSVYSQLCKCLMTSDVVLRQEASTLLSKLEVGGILQRHEDLQEKMRLLEQDIAETEVLREQLLHERNRAIDAETKLHEEMFKNEMLLAENLRLVSRNDELQRQVSMLCDGSTI